MSLPHTLNLMPLLIAILTLYTFVCLPSAVLTLLSSVVSLPLAILTLLYCFVSTYCDIVLLVLTA